MPGFFIAKGLLFNRVSTPSDLDTILPDVRLPVIGSLPEREIIQQFDKDDRHFFELPDCDAETILQTDMAAFLRKLQVLADAYAIESYQTLYIGNDMLKDIWAASSMGWKTALFAGNRRSLRLRRKDSRCKNLVPDLVIDALAQLNQVLKCSNGKQSS